MLFENPKTPLLSPLRVSIAKVLLQLTLVHMDEWADSAHILQEYIKLRTCKDGLKFKLLGV